MSGTTTRAGIHELVLGDVTADVSEVAGSLRGLVVRGTELVRGTLDPDPPFAAGVVLVPWPNRVEDGLWHLDGQPQQLEVTEPDLGNANHGLLSRARYEVVERDAGRVRLSARVPRTAGYPFALGTSVEYRLVPDGVEVVHRITNLADRDAPVALGAHPYLRLGDVAVDDLVLQVRAGRALVLDERNIPRGSVPLAGTARDLSAGMRVRDSDPHACYTDLVPHEGVVEHRLRAADGREVRLWADEVFRYVQVFVTEEFPGPDGPVTAIAVEPMTAPPNALRTGESLRWLRPAESWTARWGIRLA